MIVNPKAGTNDSPVNLAYNWKQGTTLESALRQVLSIAFPKTVITGSLNPSLVHTEDAPFVYRTLGQLGEFALKTSKSIISDPAYMGVQIVPTATGFHLFDGTVIPVAKEISYLDMIGNSTWVDQGTIQLKTVLRADLNVGDIIDLPPRLNIVQNANSYTWARNTSAFTGKYMITSIRHLGNSRQPDANSWCTVIECIDQLKPTK